MFNSNTTVGGEELKMKLFLFNYLYFSSFVITRCSKTQWTSSCGKQLQSLQTDPCTDPRSWMHQKWDILISHFACPLLFIWVRTVCTRCPPSSSLHPPLPLTLSHPRCFISAQIRKTVNSSESSCLRSDVWSLRWFNSAKGFQRRSNEVF